MQTKRKTMIVTGAAKGIGAGATNAFLESGYNVVANSLDIPALGNTFENDIAVCGVPVVLKQPHRPPEFRGRTGEIEPNGSAARLYFEDQVITIYFSSRYLKLLRFTGAGTSSEHSACLLENRIHGSHGVSTGR